MEKESSLQMAQPFAGENGKADEAELVRRYHQALKVAVDEADRAKRVKNEFLSRMSHDIKTPLNGIMGMLEIAEKNKNNPEFVHECFEKIRMSASQLLLLVNDVLDMNKLEDGNIEPSYEYFDLNELLAGCMEMLIPLARFNNIHMTVASKQKIEHPYLLGSQQYIRQIFVNIVTNAVKYNKPNGTVSIFVDEISAEGNKGVYRLIVEDTGIGMSEEFCKQVFDPFTQENLDSRTHYRGTGLGLTIVKKLVNILNGTIEVESKLGKGSKFTVILPIQINRRPRFGKIEEKVDLGKIAGLRVLLAEDNDLNAEIAGVMLEEAGVSVTRADNGQVAVDVFKDSGQGDFDLIFMDVMMPVKSGLEATKEIRMMDRPDALTVPIVALTANTMEEDVRNCLTVGMDAHISKPFESGQLYRTLASFTDLATRAQRKEDAGQELKIELHSEMGYGLTEWEKETGLWEYNHPLFMSQAFFTDGCWEINAGSATVVVLQELFYPEFTGRQIGYERIEKGFAEENIAEPDKETWIRHMSLSVLKELKKEEYFEVTMGSAKVPFSKYTVALVPGIDTAGHTERIYMTYKQGTGFL